MKLSMRELLEAGAHFGHRTRYWNPKMAEYIFGSRNKIHIINLEKTVPLFEDALGYLSRLAANHATILFVGTKRAAQDSIRKHAARCGMPYIDHRWLGGMLTNYKTVRQSIFRLKELKKMQEEGILAKMIKKEALMLTRELEKLERGLGGIQDMAGLPDALFIIDVGYENIAVEEARRLKIPVVGIVDTNNNPDPIDYVVPANDDSMRAIEIYVSAAADAILDGKQSNTVGGVIPTADLVDGQNSRKASKKAEPAVKAKAEHVEAEDSETKAEADSSTVTEASKEDKVVKETKSAKAKEEKETKVEKEPVKAAKADTKVKSTKTAKTEKQSSKEK